MSLLENLADQAPKNDAPKNWGAMSGHAPSGDSFGWLDAFLARNSGKLPTAGEWESYEGGRRKIFEVCPFNSEHRNSSAFLIQRGEGVIQAGCHHNGCAKEDWRTLRAKIEPQAPRPGRSGDAESVVGSADAPEDARPTIEIVTADKLVADAPELRPIIIEGLLRRGEVANVIAAPKTGKSWAVHNLALALATGGRWFGYQCTQGKTLLIDNELHRETLSSRLGKVAHAHGLITTHLREWVDVVPLRGNLRNLVELGATLAAIKSGTYAVVILDSLYRAIPPDIDENSNADITRLYNILDRYAAMLDAAFVVIHHTSKGVQGSKSITDVGAGAGAQARAADTHVTLRPHEEDGVIVLDAVVRSFPPPTPSCWRFEVPSFHPADSLDPTALQTNRRPRREKDESGEAKTKAEPWTPKRFAERFIGQDAKTLDRLKAEGAAESLTDRKAESLTRQAVAMGFAHEWPGKTGPNGRPKRYATIPCPVVEVGQ